ncbi:MAG TPA: divalent cation tolerance protein CutA, partial [Marine Group III euryarchaeote]|nr:divalent cation tolerance protein CutA [Marine Group III euryarchaeote]
EELEKYIVKNHPYSMPAIVSLPWDDAHEPYKNWVEKNE